MYSMKAVSLKTGLSPHTIRMWERRYNIVEPERTDSNRRIYSEQDVEKLIRLRQATEAGHSIGQLSELSDKELWSLTSRVAVSSVRDSDQRNTKANDLNFTDAAFDAIYRFDADALLRVLTRARIETSQPDLVNRFIPDLLKRIGEEWAAGQMRVAQEHMASQIIRSFLGMLLEDIQPVQSAPVLVAATVSGIRHEFGALLAAVNAAFSGWKSRFLGADLPVEEIVYAIQQMQAAALVLSLIYPPADPDVAAQLLRLGRLLPDDIPVLIGGESADSYAKALSGLNAVVIKDMHAFQTELQTIRVMRTEF